MISSHYDEDHIAGLVGCLDSFSVKNVIGADYVQDTKIYQSFEAGVASQGLSVQHPAPGTDFAFGSGKFTVLSPQSISSNDNDNSVAIRLENGNNHFLFTGDAESAGEEAICNLGIDLSCDVIVPGHHGSATATTWDLLQQTVPEYAVISCGAGNSYGHPHKDTMDKLSDMGIQVFRTDEQGTIIAVSDGNSIEWNQNPVMITHREMNPIPVHSPLPFMMIPEVLPTDPSTHPITIPRPSSFTESDELFKEAREQGIHISFIDSYTQENVQDITVATDNLEVGQILGKFAAGLLRKEIL